MTSHQTEIAIMTMTTFHIANVDNQKVFYRQAGQKDAPVLLLHGFPGSGHMFRDLIPARTAISAQRIAVWRS